MAGPFDGRPGDKLTHKKNIMILVLVLGLTLMVSGCGLFKGLFGEEGAAIEVPPQELAQEGIEAMQEERYQLATNKFQELKDRYPYSKYAILAELKLADALYLQEKYIEAAEAYGDFERLHPKNEAVPYVLYQQGLCYFNQITTYDRDQTSTVKAIQTFSRLQQTFPEDKYSAMAAAKLAEAQRTLAAHEFFVGEFYFRTKAYQAALGRFISLIKNYPDTGYHTRAMDYIKLCRAKIAEQTEEAAAADAKSRKSADPERVKIEAGTSSGEVIR